MIITKIKLQAFSGAFNPRTIHLTGWVLGRLLSILIDSGSTHNFIQELVVVHLGYASESLASFKVFIGSDEHLVCSDVCRRVEINIQNTTLIKDLFVLPMGGANIVLGIQWLAKLGPVTTNHKELTMEFNIGDKQVHFQGEHLLAEAEISKSGLQKLWAKGDIAYFSISEVKRLSLPELLIVQN